MDNEKIIRLSGLVHESLVNGPGLRRVLFSQGCIHNCKGCFNFETHSFEGGQLMDMDKIIKDIKDNPMLRGVTFSGGDPFEQAEKFNYIAVAIRNMGLNIWSYTGYTFEYILGNRNNRVGWDELLRHIDVLVDGKFEEDEKVPFLKFRGSVNQRIIDVQASLKTGNTVILDERF